MNKTDKYDKRSRNFTIFCIRLWEGCKQLRKLWKGAILGIAIAGFVWLYQQIAAIPYAPWIPLLLQTIFTCLLLGVTTAAFAFVILWLLQKFGTPWKAKRIESSLAMAFSENDLRFGRPVLISTEKIKCVRKRIERKEFYSKGISLKQWQSAEPKIADFLNCTILEPIQYGGKDSNNRSRIVLVTISGANLPAQGVLTDDDL